MSPSPLSAPRPSRPARSAAALVVVLGLSVATATAGATGSAPPLDSVTAAQALAQARAVRGEADQRLASLQARRDQIDAELQRLDVGAAEVTKDLADARRAVREYAVAAYIDGGQSKLMASAMSPGQQATVAWRSQLVGGQTVSAADAIDRLSTLKAANDPDRVAAAAQLDRVNSESEQIRSAAMQAAALERDAELAAAGAREQQAAAAAQRAAQKAAAQKAPAQKAPAPRGAAAGQAPATTRPPATAPPTTAPTTTAPTTTVPATTAPAAATPPAGPAGTGGPTSAESAHLARIRACESHGDYTVVSASGRYRGAYQFDTSTWQAVGGTGDPAAASPAEQDYRALLLLRQRGNRAWPNCA